tara:strand:- start:234 stop:878 length:645 start_codon:yes stop_codon:yes gene_type:complete
MKDLFKSSFLGSLIFLLVGCSDGARIVGITCKEKFSKKNQEITEVKLDKHIGGGWSSRTLKGTVSLNNGPEETCIPNLYKIKVDSLVDDKIYYSDRSQTKCGEHIFRGNPWNADYYPTSYQERNYMDFSTVVDKNGTQFPLKFVNEGKEIKTTCQENYSPGLVRQLTTRKFKYKVQVNPTDRPSNIKPIYLENTFYVVYEEEESFYRLPIKPNF